MQLPQQPVSRPERMVRQFLMSPPGIWFGRYVLPHLDLPLLFLSRGRYSMSPGQPILLLMTIGAKSGKRRWTPLLYLPDGERIIVVASDGGRARHPGWYYNLRAARRATVYVGGTVGVYCAREAEGEERDVLWQRAVAFFEGFALYEQRTTRRIPILILSRCE